MGRPGKYVKAVVTVVTLVCATLLETETITIEALRGVEGIVTGVAALLDVLLAKNEGYDGKW